MVTRRFLISIALIGALSTCALSADEATPPWPQWRGPLGTGVSLTGKPPVEWSETQNVRWKSAVPGRGHSTPIVLHDRVVLTAAEPVGEEMPEKYSGAPGAHDNLPVTHRHRFLVIAMRRSDGSQLWQREVHSSVPHEGAHYTASLASHSPCTDGERIYAFFGSHGLYCLDLNGDVQWKRQLGKMHSKHGHGEGSSPVLHGDTLAVNWDHEGESFVVAIDKRTGKTRWQKPRREVTSWATPIVVEHEGQVQLIVSGTDRVRAYDLKNGDVVWECGGLSNNIVASPVSADGFVYVGSSYEKRALFAIRLKGAAGDITDTDHVAWKRFRGTPYVPSPLLYDDSLYFLTHYQAIVTRLTAKSGEDDPGAIRLGGLGNIYASPVGAANRVYITDLEGRTMVIQHGKAPRVLSANVLDEPVSASAAIAGSELYLRGDKHLYCLADAE